MFPEHVIFSLLALTAGAAVAGGAFAFLLVIGVVPRLLWRFSFQGKSRRDRSVWAAETAVTVGVISGCVISLLSVGSLADTESLFPEKAVLIRQAVGWVSHILLGISGLCAGIFVGCIAASLAEIINTFPVLFRRAGLEQKLPAKMKKFQGPKLEWMVMAMAFGKLAGGLVQFIL